ncbi:MAG: hypothetical protein ACOY4R_09165 [Pseudomonadota bacterium]
MRQVDHRGSDAILGAMRQVAVASDHAITYADTVSILAAARYLLRRRDLTDIGLLPAVAPSDLVAAIGADRALAGEAVKYLAIMALVDGSLEHRKLARVLDYARALDIEADYLTELVAAASGHLAWATADMWRKNFDSVLGRSSEGLDPASWIRPYDGANADASLVARYEALGGLPQNTFGKALWDFDKRNGYPFPGDPQALNAGFGTPHDSAHVISGYDTSARGELLVSTFTAGMHPINPMSGHILPVIFFFHFGEQLNDIGHASKGGLDPDEFWHAWARGAAMTVDIFGPDWNFWQWVEHDLDELRRAWNVTPAGPAR